MSDDFFSWQLDFGARTTQEGVRFRVWAPAARKVTVHVTAPHPISQPMDCDGHQVYSTLIRGLRAGAEYFYEIDGKRRPDPVSRCQPHGVHGASRVVDPNAFAWTDHKWKGLALAQLIIYEIHTGTFTDQGTFDGMIERLDHLRDLGVTAIELMPVATFPGSRNWGYDGVFLYAPHTAYGGPEGLKRLVDACHRAGLAVILDVVYNHLGPEGNYLSDYGPYFTDTYRTPWGQALNFDGPQSDGVRQFFIDNALYWLTEYHLDALRLDAVHGIFDFGARHILQEIAESFHRQAQALGRQAWLIAESDLNASRIINPPDRGGYGLDAQWNDEFHHALHALLTGARHGYFGDFASIADLQKAITDGFVFDGRYSPFRQRRHGVSSSANQGHQFVVFNQNHDQIANAEAGIRLSGILPFARQKLAAAILICAPNLPLLFMGEEFGSSSPFFYFTSFEDPKLAAAVSEGRKREYESFFKAREFADPQAPHSFERSRLNWSELEEPVHRQLLELNRALLRLRHANRSLSNCRKDLTKVDFDESSGWMLISRSDPDRSEAFIFCNLTAEQRDLPTPASSLTSRLALSTEEQLFGGSHDSALPEILDGAKLSLRPFAAAIYVR
ncbi:MAG: malto-oligosyltrehalose trehalohydrolase [Candidatus Binataceae bacterium]|nr:malto-oligosyltrehalose trehalohydrolase [Candidatus Binataceae bacterium]